LSRDLARSGSQSGDCVVPVQTRSSGSRLLRSRSRDKPRSYIGRRKPSHSAIARGLIPPPLVTHPV